MISAVIADQRSLPLLAMSVRAHCALCAPTVISVRIESIRTEIAVTGKPIGQEVGLLQDRQTNLARISS